MSLGCVCGGGTVRAWGLAHVWDVGLGVGRMQGWESESESVLVGPSEGCVGKIKVLSIIHR